MTGLDYFVLAIAFFSVLSGAMKGIVRSLFSFGGLILGLLVALLFNQEIGSIFTSIGVSRTWASLLGFLLPLVLSVLGGSYAAHHLRKALKKTGLTPVDTAAGACLGLVRAWMFGSGVYLALTAFPVKLETVEQAKTGPALALGAKVLVQVASRDLSSEFEKGLAELRRIKAERLGGKPPRKSDSSRK